MKKIISIILIMSALLSLAACKKKADTELDALVDIETPATEEIEEIKTETPKTETKTEEPKAETKTDTKKEEAPKKEQSKPEPVQKEEAVQEPVTEEPKKTQNPDTPVSNTSDTETKKPETEKPQQQPVKEETSAKTEAQKEQTSIKPEETEEIDVYKLLLKQYPDANITESPEGYVVNSDVEVYNGKDPAILSGFLDGPVYNTLESVIEVLNLDNYIVFVGKKTNKAKQYIEVDENNYVGIYFTESIVEIITPLYGDIDAGDEIVYIEYYARFSDTEGNVKIRCMEYPVDDEIRLFVLCGGSQSILHNGKDAYCNITEGFIPNAISKLKKSYETGAYTLGFPLVADQLYEKYIVNGDLSLDEEVELEKVLQRKKMVMSHKGASEKELAEFKLSDEEIEHVKALVKKYNDLSKTKKVVTEQN